MSTLDRLYNWLNDMRLGIAPDETTPEDEKRERLAQVDVIDDIMEWIEKQRPTGHWIEEETTSPCEAYLANYRCSECHEYGGTWMQGLEAKFLPRYCMWCGARMGGDALKKEQALQNAINEIERKAKSG